MPSSCLSSFKTEQIHGAFLLNQGALFLDDPIPRRGKAIRSNGIGDGLLASRDAFRQYVSADSIADLFCSCHRGGILHFLCNRNMHKIEIFTFCVLQDKIEA